VQLRPDNYDIIAISQSSDGAL